ncbi:glycerophosphodiester phosphodiesterase [Anaerobium acetethylicum]|uniref:Glycerophosphoryl diester phosphodiesterase n=1 Tax=Anaerobium acetethylicum TaxID=1619234 RepID=A0A1D3TNC5_9FIRM|nr:glycerophosphodiester phosphodiesterase [Anaerobium acetethylicum]SCP94798.1 glycerophosphoryl diester phosphodiesterase [Anaerobium acetethylicum]
MGRLFRETILSFKRASRSMLLFEVVFKVITGLCMIPGLVLLFNVLLKVTGYSYITKNNVLKIIRNPALILFFAAALLVAAFISLLEISILTLFFGHNYDPEKSRLRGLVFLGFTEMRRLLAPKNVIMVLYVICIIPIINFSPIVRYIFGNREIPNFVFYHVIRINGFMPVVAVFAAILGVLGIQMIFVFCYFFLEHKSIRESFRCSRKLVRGRVLRTVGSILACNLFFMVVYLAFYLVVIFLVDTGTNYFYEKRVAYAVFLTAFNMTNKVLIVILGIFESMAVTGVVVQLYLHYSGKGRKPCPDICLKKEFGRDVLTRSGRVTVAVLALVFLLTGTGIFFIINQDYSLLESKKTSITAHRGYSSKAPENTMAAIEKAVDALADYAEIDVRQTKDGILVVFHDASLKRITGLKKNVSDLDYAKILLLDIGSWFSGDFSGERIPTLEEVIRYSKGKIKLNIELKNSAGDKNLEEAVVKLIEKHHFEDDCVVSSFSYKSLKKIKELNPEIKTGYILSDVYGNFYDLKKVDFFSMKYVYVTERIVTELHKRGKKIHVWTVNGSTMIERLAMIGVDNIITDYPVRARNIIYESDFPEYTTNFLKMVFSY